MRLPGWWISFCLLLSCGGQSERLDGGDDDSSSTTGGHAGTGGNSATGGSSGTAAGTAGGSTDWGFVCSTSADISCRKWHECSPRLAAIVLPHDCVGSLLHECLSGVELPDVTLGPSEYLACVEAFED